MGKALMLAGDLDGADEAFKNGTIEVLEDNDGGGVGRFAWLSVAL